MIPAAAVGGSCEHPAFGRGLEPLRCDLLRSDRARPLPVAPSTALSTRGGSSLARDPPFEDVRLAVARRRGDHPVPEPLATASPPRRPSLVIAWRPRTSPPPVPAVSPTDRHHDRDHRADLDHFEHPPGPRARPGGEATLPAPPPRNGGTGKIRTATTAATFTADDVDRFNQGEAARAGDRSPQVGVQASGGRLRQ